MFRRIRYFFTAYGFGLWLMNNGFGVNEATELAIIAWKAGPQ